MTKHDDTAAALRKRLAELTGRIEQLDRDLRALADPDFEEQATKAEGDEMMEALEESGRAEVKQIQSALDRIEKGEYGICETCGDPIAEARLKAVPYATQCIECAREA